MLKRMLAAVAGVVRKYPALSAAALNIAVALAAKFGFHVTAAELAGIVSLASALLGAWVHSQVSPVNKKAAK